MRLPAFVLASLLAIGCGKKEPPPDEETAPAAPTQPSQPAAGGSADPATAAKQIFAQRCVPCHGATGEGDGAASATLDPKPRKFSDPTWQTSVDDAHIEKVIKFGGAAVGKSPAMPGNPDLNDPAVITALKDVVRSFKK